MRSLESNCNLILQALFQDLQREYPQHSSKLGKSLSSLLFAVEHQGLSILTITMPDYGKAFEQALDFGACRRLYFPMERKIAPYGPLPVSELWDMCFSEECLLRKDVDPYVVCSLRQIFYLFKKLTMDCKPQRVYDAVKQFMATESELVAPTLDWENPFLEDVSSATKNISFTDSESILLAEQFLLNTNKVNNETEYGYTDTESVQREPSTSTYASGRSNVGAGLLQEEENPCAKSSNSKTTDHKLESSSESIAKLLSVLQQTCDVIVCQLGMPDYASLVPGNGPGVNSDGPRYRDKLSTGCWSIKLDTCFPFADFALYNYRADASFPRFERDERDTSLEPNASSLLCAKFLEHTECTRNLMQFVLKPHQRSKLISVPKTQKGPRLIAAEPTCNMFCQQALWKFLSDRCHATYIGRFLKFKDQSQNQRFAARAVKDGLATVDLSEASDRVSCYVVERLFRRSPALLAKLMASRTSIVEQNIDKTQPRYTFLKKYAAMGNATTFPVESILFLCFALAAYCYDNNKHPSDKTFSGIDQIISIFGDDIILPVENYPSLSILMAIFNLKINTTKTFLKGKFRESCGADYYDGVNVTPAYIRRIDAKNPDDVTSLVETRNNFYLKGYWCVAKCLEQIVQESKLISVLSRSVSRAGNVGIPRVKHTSGVWGYRSYCNADPSLAKRWNKDLQYYQIRCIQPYGVSKRKDRPTDKGLLQFFLENPSPLEKWEQGWTSSATLKIRLRMVPSDIIE